MNNEPVAWWDGNHKNAIGISKTKDCHDWIPLYTHPVKEQKCVVQGCENHKHEGSFNGDLCSPCYQFIAHGKGTYSQAYRNTYTVKELTDEEIIETVKDHFIGAIKVGIVLTNDNVLDFARAILRKASEE